MVHIINGRYLLFKAKHAPLISQQKPNVDPKTTVGIIEIEDGDIYKFITGGTSGVQALAQGKIKVGGDLEFAHQLQTIFINAGGLNKTKEYLKRAKAKL